VELKRFDDPRADNPIYRGICSLQCRSQQDVNHVSLLHAIKTLVATLPITPLVLLRKGRGALKISAGQIVEHYFCPFRENQGLGDGIEAVAGSAALAGSGILFGGGGVGAGVDVIISVVVGGSFFCRIVVAGFLGSLGFGLLNFGL